MDDILIHVFVVSPVIRWVMSPSRQWNSGQRNLGIGLALAVLGIVAWTACQLEPNLYDAMGLNSGSSLKEVQSHYRRMMVKYHPDKNDEPGARAIFDQIKSSYEVLSNDQKRDVYSRFGDYDLTGEFVIDDNLPDILFLLIFQTLISLVFGVVYTCGRDVVMARQAFCMYLAFYFCVEWLMRFHVEAPYLFCWVPWFGTLLPFERIRVLAACIPIWLNACLIVGPNVQDNTDDSIDECMLYVLHKNVNIIEFLNRSGDIISDVYLLHAHQEFTQKYIETNHARRRVRDLKYIELPKDQPVNYNAYFDPNSHEMSESYWFHSEYLKKINMQLAMPWQERNGSTLKSIKRDYTIQLLRKYPGLLNGEDTGTPGIDDIIIEKFTPECAITCWREDTEWARFANFANERQMGKPYDFSGIITRDEIHHENWSKKRGRALAVLVEELYCRDDRVAAGISLGTVLFFLGILYRILPDDE